MTRLGAVGASSKALASAVGKGRRAFTRTRNSERPRPPRLHEAGSAESSLRKTLSRLRATRLPLVEADGAELRLNHPAIDDRWRTWEPPAGWPVPALAAGWETLPRALG